jgi:hypothetical protein
MDFIYVAVAVTDELDAQRPERVCAAQPKHAPARRSEDQRDRAGGGRLSMVG